ncbi:MAG: DNA repair protein RadC [Ruminococcus sp.]|nr:DNA repair protein RadC [Ruminococcus sp.]
MENKTNGENIHKGHRQRLKRKFLDNGLEAFSPHEVLELLLFYTIPLKNTNDIAHELINRFGSLSAVFDAPVSSLCEVKNISENSAVLLKLVPQLLRYYQLSPDADKSMNDTNYVRRYFTALYIGVKDEEFKVCCLDNNLQVISCNTLSVGSVCEVAVSARMIAKAAFDANSQCVILAHNHPDASPNPSQEDIKLTSDIASALNPIGIEILDHIIVGKGSVYSMKDYGIID